MGLFLEITCKSQFSYSCRFTLWNLFLIVHEMCLRNYDSCVTKWVCPGEGIIHVLRLELFRIKHIPFPLEKDYRHLRIFKFIKDCCFVVFNLELMMRRCGGWVIRPTTSLSCKCKGKEVQFIAIPWLELIIEVYVWKHLH